MQNKKLGNRDRMLFICLKALFLHNSITIIAQEKTLPIHPPAEKRDNKNEFLVDLVCDCLKGQFYPLIYVLLVSRKIRLRGGKGAVQIPTKFVIIRTAGGMLFSI